MLAKLGVKTFSEALKVLIMKDFGKFKGILKRGRHDKGPELVAHSWKLSHGMKSAGNVFYEGLYSVHLQHVLGVDKKFPRENVRVYWSADMLRDPENVVEDAWSFLGLEASNHSNWRAAVAEPINSAGDTHIELPFSDQEFGHMYKSYAPFDALLEEMLGAPVPWKEKAATYIASLGGVEFTVESAVASGADG